MATYFLHAGHQQEEFETCLDDSQDVLADARQNTMCCILSGDFNIESGRGWWSSKLMAMVRERGLTACNVNGDENITNQWTLKNCLGALRRLDYIMPSDTLNFRNSRLTDLLDFGSRYPGPNSL